MSLTRVNSANGRTCRHYLPTLLVHRLQMYLVSLPSAISSIHFSSPFWYLARKISYKRWELYNCRTKLTTIICLLTSFVVDPQEQGTTKSTIYFPFTDFQANGKYLDNESFITFTTQHNICLDSARSNYFLFFLKHNCRPYLTKLLAPTSQAHWQRAGESYTALHWVWNPRPILRSQASQNGLYQWVFPRGYTYFVVLMWESTLSHMMQFRTFLSPLLRMSDFMFCGEQFYVFLVPPSL